MPGGGPDGSLDLQETARLTKKLESAQIKPEIRGAIVDSLKSEKTFEGIQASISEDDARRIGEQILTEPVPSPMERKMIATLGKIHPEVMFDIQLKLTGSGSPRVKEISGKVGDLDLTQMEKWTNADFVKFQEALKSRPEFQITKGELLKYYEIFAKIESKGPNAEKITEAKNTLKEITDVILFTMLTNGMSIESPTDIAFLKAFGPEKVQTKINEEEAKGTFKEGKFIVKTTGEEVTIVPADAANLKGMDISQINSLKVNPANPTQIIEQVQKLAGIGKEKLQELVKSLSGSKNSVLKFFGELLGGLFGLLGITSQNENGLDKPLDAKGKKDLLGVMGKNSNYDVKTFFDPQGNIINGKKDKAFQLYLADIDKLLGPSLLKKDTDGTLIYDGDTLTKSITAYQTALKIPTPTGKLDAASLKIMFERLNAEGKTIDTPQTAPAAGAPAVATAPAQAPEAPKRHALADLFLSLKGKSTREILGSKELLKTIQSKIGNNTAVQKFQAEIGMKADDPEPKKRPDGKLGAETVNAYFAAYPEGNIPKPTPQ